MNTGTEGLVYAFIRSAEGQWRSLEWPEVKSWQPGQGLLWVHLDATDPGTAKYLREYSGIDRLAQDALLEQETRPRTVASGDCLLTILRGVNLNPGADPNDLVSVRLWAEADRIISTRYRPIMAADTLRQEIEAGNGPGSTADLLVNLISRLVDRMASVIENLDDSVDELEERVLEAESRLMRTDLSQVRRTSITLRRYLAPEREALSRLYAEELSWLDKRNKARLRETTDRVIRYVEDLDSIRERAAVVQDELMNRLSDHMNRNMYLLTIVATVMLPLGFLTGLLGINVDGIPGASNTPWAFTIVCAGLAAVVAIEVWLFKRFGWLKS